MRLFFVTASVAAMVLGVRAAGDYLSPNSPYAASPPQGSRVRGSGGRSGSGNRRRRRRSASARQPNYQHPAETEQPDSGESEPPPAIPPSWPVYESPPSDQTGGWGGSTPPPTMDYGQQPPSEWQSPGGTYGEQQGGQLAAEDMNEMSLVEHYRQTATGKALVALSAAVCGIALGGLVSAWFIPAPLTCVAISSSLAFFLSFISNDQGELFRALGVTLIVTLQRWRSCTDQYPVFRQLRCMIIRRRHRFPENAPEKLWHYQPTDLNPMEFSMRQCMIAAAAVGGLAGWAVASMINLFLFPPMFLGVIFAGFSLYTSRAESINGDFVRCLAMKCAGIFGLVTGAAAETNVPTKTLAVGGRLYRWGVAFDQKHRVTERVSAVLGGAYQRLSSGSDDPDDRQDPRIDQQRKRRGGGGRRPRTRGGGRHRSSSGEQRRRYDEQQEMPYEEGRQQQPSSDAGYYDGYGYNYNSYQQGGQM